MIIDSHCHLNHLNTEQFSLDEILDNAFKKNIQHIISISTTLEEVQSIKNIALQYENISYSVGVHPSEFGGVQPRSSDDIIPFADNNRCVAVGETGLDYHYNDEKTYRDQKMKFMAHLDAANILNKPVVVHTRSAKNDTIDILKQGKVENCGGVLHCFTEDWDMAKQALDLGMYISFSGILTFKNAQQVQDVAKKVPLDRILVETDAPYLTPVPYRGKTNYPEYVYYVVKFLAELKDVDFENVCSITTNNCKKLFSIA